MSEFSILHISIVGLLLTIVLERLLIPRPALRRPLSCWLLHTGVWCVSLAVLYALTARPLFSAINVVLGWLLIVMVSNAKYHSLREPFVCADFEYFSDAVRFPRLYLPFFGIGKAALLATGFIAYLWAGLTFEPQVAGGRLDALWLGLGGLILLKLGHRSSVPSFDANADIQRWGLVACLWRYFWAARKPVDPAALASPFNQGDIAAPAAPLPDLVSVQSESFFDVRELWSGVKPQVLTEYDRLTQEALARGKLQVAAWGANTVRTEFAYLTGIPGERLGVHRFNPYRVLARKGLPSLASHLKTQGYRTVCIHPFHGSFYGRNKVLPALGFDEFIDIQSFDESQKAGPFIGDCAVADKIRELLQDPTRTQPLFIHAVTMENHGPLHLEQVEAAQLPTWFDQPLLQGMDDLAPYLRHIANADLMLGKLRTTLLEQPTEALLCFFGDHVPILPDVYQAIGEPVGDTDYLIWSNRRPLNVTPSPLQVDRLACHLLACAAQTPSTRGAA